MLESICFMMLFMVLQSIYSACICTECKAFQIFFCESDLGFPFVATNKKKRNKTKMKSKSLCFGECLTAYMCVYKPDVNVCLLSRS